MELDYFSCRAKLESHLVYERRMWVSGDGQLNNRLPDPSVFAPLSRHHEPYRLGQVHHILLGVQRAIRTDAEFGVTALKADPVILMTSLKLH